MILRIALISLLVGLCADDLCRSRHSQRVSCPNSRDSLVVELLPVKKHHQDKGTYVQAQLILRMNLRLSGTLCRTRRWTVTLPDHCRTPEVIDDPAAEDTLSSTLIPARVTYIRSDLLRFFPQRSGVLEIPPVRVRRSASRPKTRATNCTSTWQVKASGYRSIPPSRGFRAGNRWFARRTKSRSRRPGRRTRSARSDTAMSCAARVHVKADGTTGGRMPAAGNSARDRRNAVVDAGHTDQDRKDRERHNRASLAKLGTSGWTTRRLSPRSLPCG